MVQELQKVLASLESFGLLLVSDRAFPSVASLIAGEPVKGSWWSHPLAHTIFAVNEMLEDQKGVLITKLLGGKVTFVHRTMWPQVYAIGTAREDWQMEGLSTPAKTLLTRVEKETCIDTDKIGVIRGTKPGDLARELELRILIHAEQVHTESGAHAKRIQTWESWADRVGFKARQTDPQVAKKLVEKRVKELNKKFGADVRLPWLTVYSRQT